MPFYIAKDSIVDINKPIFISLYQEACEKCFGFSQSLPLSETDSKLLSNKIFEHTGLVIGARSIKNYSIYISNTNSKEINQQNPSVATLDTLARYVLDAPYTNEINRRENESHYPYWFQYRSKFPHNLSKQKTIQVNKVKTAVLLFGALIIIIGIFTTLSLFKKDNAVYFTDDFNSVDGTSLEKNGWIIKSADSIWWNRRNEKPGHLSLYTLRGDNWALGENYAGIKNLVMRKISSDCFMVEIHLSDFVPEQNWQQAGILLAEDSTFTGKMIRLSVSYNNYFGGFEKPGEIIIQAISSSEGGSQSKPEEIAHQVLFSMEPAMYSLAVSNLAKTALKIEKKGTSYRFLYNAAPVESFAFKEVAGRTLNISPRFIGIFSIQGWADTDNRIPACFDSFSLIQLPCAR